MKRIAVLGANGQLGQTLNSLVDKEPDSYSFYSKEDVDITDKESISTLFNKNDFDFCVNCAAFTNVELAEKNVDQAFLVNAEGAKNIAEVCQSKNIKLVHISTDYVFDGKKREPYTTKDKTDPINQYGRSKLKGELYIKETIKEHYIIRTSWLYSLFGKNFLKTIVNKTKQNVELKITTEEQGTPTSCLDLSRFIIYLIKSHDIHYGIYHFSAKGKTTWYGFAKEIVKHFNSKKTANIFSVDSYKTIAKRPKYSVLDILETEKVYRNLNEWQESLKAMIEELKI
ncbi:dTDP-4-dehydrorhamnose reductase [Winogradskyella ouciana]|uniref:dTDP-4-dehydrorhamnose reductase n=1 Tax=Winogradskyella ouciana TaxID=2608631 RepID=A0A7K1GFM5_9FLAO|nr:dTDP-4-dehydrorhamnose reductase [Winogradskyella ouciana]MTE27198.1 dTDP-4-dehydrorhamnose reductase [Winogradskyella ouciana]